MHIIKRIFLAILSVGLLGSCSSSKPTPTKKEYLVNFNTNEGSFVPAQLVEENNTIREPANPTREYYTFEHWEYNGEKFDFSQPITSDVTLSANWSGGPSPEDGYWLVSFNSDGGTYVPAQVIKEGERATKPTKPTKVEGTFTYDFAGWFYNGRSFDFENTPIMSSITLTAHWNGTPPIPTEYRLVDFDSDGGSYVAARRVEYNKAVSEPTPDPTKVIDGYTYHFDGWYLNDELYVFSTPVTENITLKAKWSGTQPVYYLVEFDSDGGTHVESQTIEYDKHAKEPNPAPTKVVGDYTYTFDGWFNGSDKFKFTETTITSNLTLKAHWSGTPPTYSLVEFDSDGGTYVESQTIENGKYATEPNPAPTKVVDGYSYYLEGWFNGSNKFEFTKTAITSNLTLKARWSGTPPTYSLVEFDSDGGTHVESQTIENGKYATEPNPAPTKVVNDFSYHFDGWFNGSNKFEFTKTAITSNLTLKAHWSGAPKVYYTVNFESNGGTHIDPKQVEENTPVSIPTEPTKADGSTFDGWYDNAALIGNAYDFDKGVTANLTLYAKWIDPVAIYTVTFVMNGAESDALDPITVEEGKTIAEPEAPTKLGYIFSGWYTDEGFTNVFKFNTEIMKDYILYANWGELKTYTIEFYDGNSKLDLDQTIKYGEKIQRPENPTKDNFTFSGWYQEATLDNEFNFDLTITNLNITTIKIYAKWDDTMYTVTFASNGGSIVLSQSVKSGGTILTSPTTTYAGHTFAGWFTDDNTFTNEFKFGTLDEEATPVTSSIVLYAKWTLNSVKVIIDYNHDELSKEIYVDYGTVIPAQDVPKYEGNGFTGWYDAATGGNIWNFTNPIIDTTTIYAHWSPLPPEYCMVFFYPTGGNITGSQSCYSMVGKGVDFKDIYKPVPIKTDGSTFRCWSLDPDQDVTSGIIDKDIVAYARWNDNTTGISFFAPRPEDYSYYFPCYSTSVNTTTKMINSAEAHLAYKRIMDAEIEEDHTFIGFAYSKERAEAGYVDFQFTLVNLQLPLPDALLEARDLYPVFKINNFSISIIAHGYDPFVEPPSPVATTEPHYDITYPKNFDVDKPITIDIELAGHTSYYPVYYYIPDFYLEKCFQLTCDGVMTDVVYTLTPDHEGAAFGKYAKITIGKATGNITLNTWLYATDLIK